MEQTQGDRAQRWKENRVGSPEGSRRRWLQRRQSGRERGEGERREGGGRGEREDRGGRSQHSVRLDLTHLLRAVVCPGPLRVS